MKIAGILSSLVAVALPLVAAAVQPTAAVAGSSTLFDRPAVTRDTTPTSPMITGTVDAVSGDGRELTVDGLKFAVDPSATPLHLAASVSNLDRSAIEVGSRIRFVLSALSADGQYDQAPSIVEIWVGP